MSLIKSSTELELMREGGKRLRVIREQLLAHVQVGITPLEIDILAQKLIKAAGGVPSFMTVNGYKWATCISVNDGVVHGVPTTNPFKPGDRVGVDVGLLFKGFHTDTSWSVYLPSGNQEKDLVVTRFLKVGESALDKAIVVARAGNHVGHISQTIQSIVEGAGYSVVRTLVGHGVGKSLHESPQIPGVLVKPIPKTPLLTAGMVIAIEVIYNMGKPEIVYASDDGWTLASGDGSLSGLFEHTVAITPREPIVLT